MQSLQISQSHRQKQTLRQELTQAQLHQTNTLMISYRIQLIGALRDTHYKPYATCPNCGRKLTVSEIIEGFVNSTSDIRTTCPACKHKFTANNRSSGMYSYVDLPFYCPMQVQDMLRDKRLLSPSEIEKTDAAIYHSAIVHFGTLGAAFKGIGIAYNFSEEDAAWKGRVHPYLGLLPDTTISSIAGVSVYQVRKLRNTYKISKYTPRKLLEAMG